MRAFSDIGSARAYTAEIFKQFPRVNEVRVLLDCGRDDPIEIAISRDGSTRISTLIVRSEG